MRRCTWVNCAHDALHLQLDKAKNQWADLCDLHDAELDSSIKDGPVKRMLSNWVKAKGGARKAMESM